MGWTPRQENRLTELKGELHVLNEQRAGAVSQLEQALRAAGICAADHDVDRITQWADALRDALAPFDSGMREA